MNKSYKKLGLALLVLTMLVCVMFAGCKDATQIVTGISIKTGDEPRLTYVQGQDLDLASGTLTVIKEDVAGNETVSLSAPEVMVSGYDANKLGDQTITVTYGEFTTQFDVKVIPRMQISGYKSEYMLDEEFSTKGSVVIANDDGTTKSLSLNDSSIKIEGFDSSDVMSALTLTVTYKNGATTHSCTFDVSIKPAEEVKITLPTNRIQYSHQEELDLSGGQIIVTFGGKQIPVVMTQDMVTGYDPGAATKENLETPLVQTVTITYAGVAKTYDVEIYYTAVSLIKDYAKEFTPLEFNEEEGTLVPHEVFGPQAIEAMTEYYKLKASERLLIPKVDREKVARHAIAYGRVELLKSIAELEKTFTISNGGFVWMIDGSHADAVKANQVINDDTSDFVTLGTLLYRIKEEFAETELVSGAIVENNIPEAYPPEALESARGLLEYILELHDQMNEAMPIDKTDWTTEDLYTPEMTTALTSIVGKVMNSNYSGYNFVPIYQMLSTWRENDDYFDIIYAHYYYGGEEKLQMVGQMFQKVPLPRMLQDIYAGIANGYAVAAQISRDPEQAIWYPVEGIFRAYRQVLKAQEALETSGSDFCKELYDYLGMKYFVENNLIFSNSTTNFANGYFDQAQEMYGDEAFDDLWNSYLDIYDMVNEFGQVNLDDPETQAATAEVFRKFAELPPSWQYSFIASMHSRYRETDRYSKGGRLALDFTDGTVNNNFTYLFANYFATKFSYKDGVDAEGNTIIKAYETAQSMTKMLFRVIEMYALHNQYNTLKDFGYEMSELETLYGTLQGKEKEVFDTVLGSVYRKYIAVWKQTTSTQAPEWGEYESVVKEMQEALKVYFQMEANINNPTLTAEQKAPYYPLMYVAYEKIAACGQILNSITDENLRYAYYQTKFEINAELTCSLEHGWWKARDGFITTMVGLQFVSTDKDGNQTPFRAWEVYQPSGLQAFMAHAYYIMATQQAGGTFDAAKVLEVMAAYRAETLSLQAQNIFYALSCQNLYYEGLTTFMNTLAGDTKALGLQLLEVEKRFYEWRMAQTDEAKAEKLAALKTAMDEAIALQAAVTSTDEYNTVLKDMYDYYHAAYQLLQQEEAA